MRLYRVSWHDQDAGRCYEWHQRRPPADRSARDLRGMLGSLGATDVKVERIFLPGSADAMADWLNRNFNRHNG